MEQSTLLQNVARFGFFWGPKLWNLTPIKTKLWNWPPVLYTPAGLTLLCFENRQINSLYRNAVPTINSLDVITTLLLFRFVWFSYCKSDSRDFF